MIRKSLTFCFCIVLLSVLATQVYSAQAGITVISSNQSEFHFKVTTDSNLVFFQNETISDGSWDTYRNVIVAIPPGASAQLVSAEQSLPTVFERSAEYKVSKDQSVLPRVQISNPYRLRGLKVVSVTVRPYSGKTLYRETEVKLQFLGGKRLPSVGREEGSIFSRLLSTVVSNYDQASGWASKRTMGPSALSVAPNDLTLATTWYKIRTTVEGLHKVTGSQLQAAGISLSALDPDSIRVFSAGGLRLPESNDSARPIFQEISLLMNDDGDNLFGSTDNFIFYGEAVDRWSYPAGSSPLYVNNPYTTENIYWLAVSGSFSSPASRMAVMDVTPSAGSEDTIITTAYRDVHVEQDRLLSKDPAGHVFNYYDWYWADSTSMSIFVPTPAAITGQSADIYLKGKTSLGTGGVSFMEVKINGTSGFSKSCNSAACQFQTSSLIDGLSRFDIQFGPLSSKVPPFFDYLELTYRATLSPENDYLDINLRPFNGRARIEIEDLFSTNPLLFNLSDAKHPLLLQGFQRSGGLLTFESDLFTTTANRYFIATEATTVSPLSIEQAVFTNLRQPSSRADLIIVTDPSFSSALDEYVNIRSSQGYSVQKVFVKDIMDNFSYGLYDPTAIRDFLKYAYENYQSPTPSTVLFVGDGSYDYVGNLGVSINNLVPPYIRATEEAYSDDAFIYFGKAGILDSDSSYQVSIDRGYDMIAARWPVTSVSQIRSIISKIKRYESSQSFGEWRNEIVLVADDQYGGTSNSEVFHTTQTEDLEKNHIPIQYLRQKIYLWEYPFVNREKPAANDAIVAAFNSGAAIVNYVGHGNPDVWAHEHVLERTADLPRMNNYNRLPLVYTASCDISFYDDPLREGMGEDLLAMEAGGAIAIVAPTRLVYSSSNAAFNRQVFDVLLTNDSLSMCEAVYAAKLLRQIPGQVPQINDQKYIFLGGPFVKLASPQLNVVFTQAPDSLVALEKTRVSGRIVDDNGALVALTGMLQVNVLDSDRDKLFQIMNGGNVVASVPYKVRGSSIYRGPVSVTGGQFDFQFIVPLDIGFGGQGARIGVYAAFDTIDAYGLIDSISVSDSVGITSDSSGPVIAIEVSGRNNFTSGGTINPQERMLLSFIDSSGINLSDQLGHGISLEIDGKNEAVKSLTSQFVYDQDKVTTGSVEFTIEDISPGMHQFKVKAWDNANNLSVLNFSAIVNVSGPFAINGLLNYPNPMRDSTTFYFDITEPVGQFTIEIFTLAGRRIRTFRGYDLVQGQYPSSVFSAVWDGRDETGDRVATGVYIYKALAHPVTGDEAIESFGKVVLVN